MNEVDFKPQPARVSGLQSHRLSLQIHITQLLDEFSDYDRTNRRPFEGKRGGTYGWGSPCFLFHFCKLDFLIIGLPGSASGLYWVGKQEVVEFRASHAVTGL